MNLDGWMFEDPCKTCKFDFTNEKDYERCIMCKHRYVKDNLFNLLLKNNYELI